MATGSGVFEKKHAEFRAVEKDGGTGRKNKETE